MQHSIAVQLFGLDRIWADSRFPMQLRSSFQIRDAHLYRRGQLTDGSSLRISRPTCVWKQERGHISASTHARLQHLRCYVFPRKRLVSKYLLLLWHRSYFVNFRYEPWCDKLWLPLVIRFVMFQIHCALFSQGKCIIAGTLLNQRTIKKWCTWCRFPVFAQCLWYVCLDLFNNFLKVLNAWRAGISCRQMMARGWKHSQKEWTLRYHPSTSGTWKKRPGVYSIYSAC